MSSLVEERFVFSFDIEEGVEVCVDVFGVWEVDSIV
jgi:hypothetical protein